MSKQKFQSDMDTYKPPFNLAQSMRNAVAATGKSYLSQARDIVRLMRKPSLLTPQDYYYFQLYDDSRYDMEHKQRFLSDQAHWGVINQCCDRSWWAVADDKHLSYTLLDKFGAATPHTQCVYSTGTRNYGQVITCHSADQLAAFFRDGASFPLFAKPNSGVGSFGAFLIEGYDSEAKEVSLFGGEPVPLDSFCQQIEAADGYLLQDVLKPHPELVPICGERISTIRVIVLMDQSSPEIIHAVWKIPAPDSIADNFWRKGNMLGAVDLQTGRVTRVVSGYGFDLREIQSHPETHQAIAGIRLPDWPELKDLCLKYARVFEKIRYLSWDIALCPQGPVVVEVNTGSSFMLSQLATGEGFLTDRFRAFLENCGYFKNPRSLAAT